MAKEHGLEEHKGKTIPAEVRSLADRIRKKDPSVTDEYAYRTAWDIYRSYTAEGKSYPHKSPESGLKREGGGTGPLSKSASINEQIWLDMVKHAMSVKSWIKPPKIKAKISPSQVAPEIKPGVVNAPPKKYFPEKAMGEVKSNPSGGHVYNAAQTQADELAKKRRTIGEDNPNVKTLDYSKMK